jgi:hypothetical protein
VDFTHDVPVEYLDKVRERVTRAQARADRLGVPQPSASYGTPRLIPDPLWDGLPETAPSISASEVTLTAPEHLGLPGYSLLARVDRLPDGSPLIARTPGTEDTPIPEVVDALYCDHCRHRRRRNETFLVNGPTGIRQVGRNCLRDFLGADPAALLWWSRWLKEQATYMGEARGERLWPTGWALLTASRVASRIGYMSARRADELMEERGRGRPQTTRGRVEDYGHDLADASKDRKAAKAVEAFEEEFPDDDGAHRLFAATAGAINDLTGREGEWQANILSICGQDAIRPRHLGVAVSAVILGLKAIDAPTRKATVISHYLGAIGDKVTVEGRIERLIHTDGQYGARTGVKVRADGADLIWWASKYIDDLDLPVDTAIRIKGTVKRHEVDRYTNRETTGLTRARITELEA